VAGHNSLREITRDHIQRELPAEGSDRALVRQALRSLFTVLKARRLVFTNPTAHIRTGRPETREPLPMPVSVLREALHSEQPARALHQHPPPPGTGQIEPYLLYCPDLAFDGLVSGQPCSVCHARVV
jgi:hypothetical protein